MDPKHQGELSPEEMAGEIAEALPERAAMSTVSVTGLDAATGTVEAVSDGVTESAAAATEPVETTTTDAPLEATSTDAPVEATTTAAPEPAEAAPEATTTAAPEPAAPAEQAHGGGPSATAVAHANEHSHVAQQAAQQAQPETAAPSGAEAA